MVLASSSFHTAIEVFGEYKLTLDNQIGSFHATIFDLVRLRQTVQNHPQDKSVEQLYIYFNAVDTRNQNKQTNVTTWCPFEIDGPGLRGNCAVNDASSRMFYIHIWPQPFLLRS